MHIARRFSSSYLLYSLSVLIFLVDRSDCFRFVRGVYPGAVYANRSQVALFRWKYDLEGADASSLKISCGYIVDTPDGDTKLVELVKKKGHTMAMTHKGSLPGQQYTDVETYQENIPRGGIDHSVVGFQIRYAQLSHPTKYKCEALYRVGVDDIQTKKSVVKSLVVLDPPVLVDCLQNLREVMENHDIEFSCSATGNPPPTLQCRLLSGVGNVLEQFPEPASPSNISLHIFRKVGRLAEEIMCLADGGEHTGMANVTQILVVHHTPFAPEFVEFRPATNHSCIRLRWSVIPMNETGGEITAYKIDYYETTHGKISAKTVRIKVQDLTPVDDFIEYEITGLNRDLEYTIEVSGVNQYGDGHFEPVKTVPSMVALASRKDDDASVGVIIGGIIAGIVFIVIFVVLAVWCSTRSKKHEKFPTSHVEDAVDYPAPTVGHVLYSSIHDKNKNKTSRAGSTNEYPDVVNDTSEKRPMVSSNSYEESNKAFV